MISNGDAALLYSTPSPSTPSPAMKSPCFIALAAILLASTVSPGEENSSGAVRVWSDLPFLDPDRSEKLDLFLPAGPPPPGGFPAVVLIHGGGFGGGSKNAPGNIANSLSLARKGFAVANIDYLLATPQKRSWPIALHDCKNAVRFLRTQAASYQINTDRISVMGASAGGQLALLVGLTTNQKDLASESPYPGISDKVHRVIDLFGGTNFLTRRVVGSDGEPTDKPYYATAQGLLGSQTPDNNPELWAQASPVTHVHPDAPPILIIHGKKDKAVDYHQALELAAALERVGAPHTLVLVPDLGHGFGTKGMPDEMLTEIVSFLNQ